MRFNCHAHIFNFKSVFTRETVKILVNRLAREKWPSFAIDAAEKLLAKHLKGEMLTEDAVIAEIVGAINADDALKGLLKKAGASLPPSVTVALEGDISGLPIAALKEILSKFERSLGQLDDDDAVRADVRDFVAFLAIGLKPSIEAVAKELLESTDRDTAVVALMLDITEGGAADEALFQAQIEDTARAALSFPGRLLPFVAVNPLRAMHYERMTHALEERGFVGVKLYPSLGYKVASEEMERVYSYCDRSQTPLLMHCNAGGFYRKASDIEECNPALWAPILEQHAALRICFGHFGGDENLTGDDIVAGSWTETIITLMRAFPGRVFADISYHDDPMNGGDPEKNYFANLKALLADEDVGPHILFGSDFHLVRQRLHEKNLWEFFRTRFSDDEFKLITETNPRAYLGFQAREAPSENLLRHVRFLAKHNFEVKEPPAEWVTKALKDADINGVVFFPNEFGSNWTQNNEAHFYLNQFFREMMTRADAESLSFKQCGSLRMRDLPNWPRQSLPDNIRSDALLGIAADLHGFLTQAPEPAAVLEGDGTAAKARKAVVNLLGDPDTQIAAFGPAIDSMYRFKSEA
jgi:predicted TIM-barrel fold metal-dependent hydrolase